MTKPTYSKEEDRQAHLQAEAASSEREQILHLKQLLVTLKQHYEKSLHQARIQLQVEQNQSLTAKKELEKVQNQWIESQKFYEEELSALREQQITLKELLKKTQEELHQIRNPSDATDLPNSEFSQQRVEQLERMVPYLRDQTEKAHVETEQLREKLSEAQRKIKVLEEELLKNHQHAQNEIEQLQQLLEEQRKHGHEIETVVSTTSSHHLRRELDTIKHSLAQGSQEIKALETYYIEILNEKIGLEHQCKQLQLQLEHQSSNLTSFQEQMHELEERRKSLEVSLQVKEAEYAESCQHRQTLQTRIEDLSESTKEKELIQDKYEQLKEEWKQLSVHLEEAIELRTQADQHLRQLEAIASHQEIQLQEFAQQLQTFHQEKGTLEAERDQLKHSLDESETRLKIAQQHLAKKVKEAALLSEKLEEQQMNLSDFSQTVEHQRTQLAQLQASVDLYQRQEKRLQEQLHEALKGTESQIIKWEEKYFLMYDKWQESENRIQELRKFEEKHLQMQSLLANLGNFMGGAFHSSNSLLHSGQEIAEPSVVRPFAFEAPLADTSSSEASKTESHEEKYDLFGMRQPPEKYNPSLFT